MDLFVTKYLKKFGKVFYLISGMMVGLAQASSAMEDSDEDREPSTNTPESIHEEVKDDGRIDGVTYEFDEIQGKKYIKVTCPFSSDELGRMKIHVRSVKGRHHEQKKTYVGEQWQENMCLIEIPVYVDYILDLYLREKDDPAYSRRIARIKAIAPGSMEKY